MRQDALQFKAGIAFFDLAIEPEQEQQLARDIRLAAQDRIQQFRHGETGKAPRQIGLDRRITIQQRQALQALAQGQHPLPFQMRLAAVKRQAAIQCFGQAFADSGPRMRQGLRVQHPAQVLQHGGTIGRQIPAGQPKADLDHATAVGIAIQRRRRRLETQDFRQGLIGQRMTFVAEAGPQQVEAERDLVFPGITRRHQAGHRDAIAHPFIETGALQQAVLLCLGESRKDRQRHRLGLDPLHGRLGQRGELFHALQNRPLGMLALQQGDALEDFLKPRAIVEQGAMLRRLEHQFGCRDTAPLQVSPGNLEDQFTRRIGKSFSFGFAEHGPPFWRNSGNGWPK